MRRQLILNGGFRKKCLNTHLCESLDSAETKIEKWDRAETRFEKLLPLMIGPFAATTAPGQRSANPATDAIASLIVCSVPPDRQGTMVRARFTACENLAPEKCRRPG